MYNNKSFKIFRLADNRFLVVILSIELTSTYWKDLQGELASYPVKDAEVFFDFLYRNGLKNRFFRSRMVNSTLSANSLRRCEDASICEKSADSFFAHNPNLVDSSVMTPFQKIFYKRKIAAQR